MWTAEFSSANFLPYLPEDCQANPGVYGFELALWLSQELAKQQVHTSYPLGEDWGWFIEYSDGATEVMIGCSSVAAENEGYSGEPILWRIFVTRRKSLLQRFKGQATPGAIEQLCEAVERALREGGYTLALSEA